MKLLGSKLIHFERETDFGIEINGKKVMVKRVESDDINECETEIFLGKKSLTEEEQEEVLEFISDLK